MNQIELSGDRQTLIPDIQGSIVASLPSTSATLTKTGYRPFGQSATATGSYRYTGRRIDAETNGLYYYRARMYSPALGRFLQPDPAGYAGGRNLYAYVGNDPLNKTDPNGKCPWCVVGALIGGGTDLAAQLYKNGWHLSKVDFVETAAAAAAGAITGGASAFIGGTIKGAGALALAVRAVANVAVGATTIAGQTAVLNNFDGHNDSYQVAAAVGGVFGAAGSLAGDVLTAGIRALTPPPNVTLGQVNLAINFASLNNINIAPAGVVTGQALDLLVGSSASFVPLK